MALQTASPAASLALKSTQRYALDQLWYIGMLDEGSMYYSQTEGTNVTWPYLPGALSSTNTNTNINTSTHNEHSKKLTFNAEMFLRILCICHTVVVEKDYDTADIKQDHPLPDEGVGRHHTAGPV